MAFIDKIKDLANSIVDEARKTPARYDYDRDIPKILQSVRSKKDSMDILDVGCGDGRYAALFPGDRYVGVDPGLIMDEIVISDTKKLMRGTMQNLPFADGSFDLVFCSLVLEHIEDVPAALNSIFRVLRPGGALVLTTATKYARWIGEMQNIFWNIEDEHEGQAHHYFETPDLVAHHTVAGFQQVDVSYIGGPFGLTLECFRTFCGYAMMKVKGETYQHGKDSVIVSAGQPTRVPCSTVTWKMIVKGILYFPKYVASHGCWVVDKGLGTSQAKVVCIVAKVGNG